MSRFLIAATSALVGALVAPPALAQESLRPSKAAFTVKTGDVRLVKDSQNVHDTDWTFDRSSSSVFALEGEGFLAEGDGNLSLGGEALEYRNSVKRAGFQGSGFEAKVNTLALLAKSKYYFRPSGSWTPYIGGGAGVAWANDDGGPVHSNANGFAYEGVVGMQLRTRQIGVRLEYVALRTRVDDADSGTTDLSMRGVFVGVSFFFGRR